MSALRVRYRRAAASASGSFPGFPQLAKGLASGGALRLFTDQVLPPPPPPPPPLLLLLLLHPWGVGSAGCYASAYHVCD